MAPSLDRDHITAAYQLIEPWIRRTPVVEVPGREFGLADCRLIFKLEYLQMPARSRREGPSSIC